MKIVFMGTPEFAVPTLRQLLMYHEVVAVYTQPDRPAGRGNKLQISPIKALALDAGIDVIQPVNFKQKEVRESLACLNADVFIVAAYGIILPKSVLDMPRLGCINVHASLLPKYRGASPIHAVIKNGETTTGITIMYMDVGIDTGDMIYKQELTIYPKERVGSLHDRLAELGGECIIEALMQLEAGTAARIPQDDADSSYAPMIQKSDGLIDWSCSTQQIINLIRAFDPWPGSYTIYEDQFMKIWHLSETENQPKEDILPGTILAADQAQGILVQTGSGVACILEIQASGSKRMTAKDYLRGREIKVGAILNR